MPDPERWFLFLRCEAYICLTVFPSWFAVRGREAHYLLSGSADGTIMAWKIGSGKGEVTLLCIRLI